MPNIPWGAYPPHIENHCTRGKRILKFHKSDDESPQRVGASVGMAGKCLGIFQVKQPLLQSQYPFDLKVCK